MDLVSRIDIAAPSEAIWPLFFTARMDDRIPLPFRFGLPKAVSCSITQGDGSPGSTRRCITTRGYMDQIIDVADPMRRFAYHLVESDYWGQRFIDHVSDDIVLEPLADGKTRVTRRTSFDAKGLLKLPGRLVMYAGFVFAHRYANQNWDRLARQNLVGKAPGGEAAVSPA